MLKSELVYFEQVVYSKAQIELLYSLLKKRTHSISHKRLPTFEEHKNFVEGNPYRCWYIVKDSTETLGSFYIKRDNSIGLNLIKPEVFIVEKILSYIRKNFEPNPEEPSIIPSYYYINVATKNKKLIKILEALGEKKMQVSFKLRMDNSC